jgi:ABC-type transport system substrate-binding protein
MAWFDSRSLAVTSAYWSGFNSQTINKMAHKASQQMNPQNAAPLYQSIDTSLWTSLPSLPLLTEVQTIAWSSAIQGVTTNPFPPGVLGGLLTWDVTAVNP